MPAAKIGNNKPIASAMVADHQSRPVGCGIPRLLSGLRALTAGKLLAVVASPKPRSALARVSWISPGTCDGRCLPRRSARRVRRRIALHGVYAGHKQRSYERGRYNASNPFPLRYFWRQRIGHIQLRSTPPTRERLQRQLSRLGGDYEIIVRSRIVPGADPAARSYLIPDDWARQDHQADFSGTATRPDRLPSSPGPPTPTRMPRRKRSSI